jgi:two-component system, NarL family, response regulator NreC
MSIRVVLVDDHAIVRTGLKAVLADAPDIDVVGEASGGNEAVALMEHSLADVVVMDLSMAEGDGLTATRELTHREDGPRVLVLTMHAEEDYLVPVLEAGAVGYLVKSAADRELVDAVRAVAHGDVYMRPAAARVLAKNPTKKDPLRADRERFERLTERERDVLRLTAQGFSAPEVGERLFISPKTAGLHVSHILAKLNVGNRTQAADVAHRHGLVQGSPAVPS